MGSMELGWKVIWGGRGERRVEMVFSQCYDPDHPPSILASLLVILVIDSFGCANDIGQNGIAIGQTQCNYGRGGRVGMVFS